MIERYGRVLVALIWCGSGGFNVWNLVEGDAVKNRQMLYIWTAVSFAIGLYMIVRAATRD